MSTASTLSVKIITLIAQVDTVYVRSQTRIECMKYLLAAVRPLKSLSNMVNMNSVRN